MSSKDHTLLIVGIACVVIGAACLLLVHLHRAPVSNSHTSQTVVASGTPTVAVASTTSSASASTTEVSGIVQAQVSLETPSTSATNKVSTAGMQFEVVMTTAAQNRGLGGRAVIPDNYAMLFVFPTDGTPGFWMKDMLTSIDMIWVADDGTIVAIDPSVAVATYPEAFYPPQPIRYVLETRAGFAAEKGWTVGTQIQLPAPYGS
jgi:uncharacterized membrane protein (UPF0127 family)